MCPALKRTSQASELNANIKQNFLIYTCSSDLHFGGVKPGLTAAGLAAAGRSCDASRSI